MHGSLFEKVKTWCAFNAYFDRRIILLDPSGGSFIKGFNPFRKRVGLEVSAQTSGMIEAVMSVWGDSSPNAYPVMFKLLKVIFTVMVERDIPLSGAFQLLSNRQALNDAVSLLSDPLVKSLWSDLSRLSQSEWSRSASPTINRLFRIVQSKAVQRYMCAPSGDHNLELTFEDTILVNLATSGSLDADAAKTFCALLLNDLYHSAKRRKGRDSRSPTPYYVYVDEWWQVPSPDFGRILAETRKFGLLLVLANQDLSQVGAMFTSEFKQSLLTLCQVQCCFGGVNHTDAVRLSKEWGLPEEAVKGLAERQCIIKLPRLQAQVITVPDVKDPFVREGRLAEFERHIARKTNSLALEDADRALIPLSTQITPEQTIDGYAVL
jgi:hypothetical protein